MESMYLPTFPNIFGLKLQLLLQIFFALGIFLVLAFLLWYFIVKCRGRKKLYKQLEHLQFQASRLGKQMLAQKIGDSEGKQLLVFFIEYLERFATNASYHSIDQLLAQHGFEDGEIESMMKVLYQSGHLEEKIREKIQLTTNK
ncbi:MAG: hypothetical protein CO170_03235 [candidate division SR1 bacterium CG_4_9_14_3_um_filter_40_9]|nr:MAG: hypothetical protein CO170_03235 [candidate division SR1 bacterium CG_4_9_14_3_um_filter_40_9]